MNNGVNGVIVIDKVQRKIYAKSVSLYDTQSLLIKVGIYAKLYLQRNAQFIDVLKSVKSP